MELAEKLFHKSRREKLSNILDEKFLVRTTTVISLNRIRISITLQDSTNQTRFCCSLPEV
jgi:hypothetical protein